MTSVITVLSGIRQTCGVVWWEGYSVHLERAVFWDIGQSLPTTNHCDATVRLVVSPS